MDFEAPEVVKGSVGTTSEISQALVLASAEAAVYIQSEKEPQVEVNF